MAACQLRFQGTRQDRKSFDHLPVIILHYIAYNFWGVIIHCHGHLMSTTRAIFDTIKQLTSYLTLYEKISQPEPLSVMSGFALDDTLETHLPNYRLFCEDTGTEYYVKYVHSDQNMVQKLCTEAINSQEQG